MSCSRLTDRFVRRLALMTMRRTPERRGPEQVVIEAVQAELGSGTTDATDNPLAPVREELRQIAFDGCLRSEIDCAIDDPDLAVG
jgi:hypothetical protein